MFARRENSQYAHFKAEKILYIFVSLQLIHKTNGLNVKLGVTWKNLNKNVIQAVTHPSTNRAIFAWPGMVKIGIFRELPQI